MEVKQGQNRGSSVGVYVYVYICVCVGVYFFGGPLNIVVTFSPHSMMDRGQWH